jgi:hypothetical protein
VGAVGMLFIPTKTEEVGEVQPESITVKVYVPPFKMFELTINGFLFDVLKLLGPVQL